MEPTKYFNNVIIGQFVLTGVPVKVYTGDRYLTITDADDVEDATFGFGMDEDGDMQRFDYRNVIELMVSGNRVDLETYNKGMEAKFGGGGEEKAEEPEEDKEEPKEEPKEESFMKLGSLMNEEFVTLGDLKLNAFQKRKFDKHLKKHNIKIDKEEINSGGHKEITYSAPTERDLVHLFKAAGGYYPDGGVQWINKEHYMPSLKSLAEASREEIAADVEGAEAQIDAAKAKTKAAKAAEKTVIKKAKEKIKAAQSQPIDEGHSDYTFGVGDIVKNKNTSCPHHGSMGVVKKLMKLANDMGIVAVYTVMNSGPTYKPGDSLAKTIDQLEPIQKPDGVK